MATKKAKKTSKKTAATAPKVTTTVVSKATPAFKPNFLKILSGPKDIDGVFSAKTLSLLFVELIGAMIMALVFNFIKGQQFFMALTLIGLAVAFSGFAITFFNPLITFGAWLTQKISAKKALLMVLAQVLGTMLAFVLLNSFISGAGTASEEMAAYGITSPTIYKLLEIPKNKEQFVFFAELIGATAIGFMMAQAHKRSASEKAVIAGGSLFVGLLVAGSLAGYVEGASLLNPALTITALQFTNENWAWSAAAYILAPILGGILGFLLSKVLVKDVTTTLR